MDANGVGIGDIDMTPGQVWHHRCRPCDYDFESNQQVDTCHLCGRDCTSIPDEMSQRVETEPLPEKLVRDIQEENTEKD